MVLDSLVKKEFSPEIEARIKAVVQAHEIKEKEFETPEIKVLKKEMKKEYKPKVHDEDTSTFEDETLNDIVDAFVGTRSRATLDELDDETLNKLLVMINQEIGTTWDSRIRPELEVLNPTRMQRIANYMPYAFGGQIQYLFKGTDNTI